MDQYPGTQPAYDLKAAKKQFSRIGLALVAFLAATYAAVYLLYFLLAYLISSIRDASTAEALLTSPIASALLSAVSMYAIGVPVFCLCLRGTKHAAPPRGKVHFVTIGILFLIGHAFAYFGNIIGTLSSVAFETASGLSFAENATDVVLELPWYVTLLWSVLLAPFFEELVFRKMILDRTRAYGEKLAILFSALLFAFFHANLEQFFYALLFGPVLSYLYLRTGKLSACWLLHAVFNFADGFLPSLLLQQMDMDALYAAQTAEEQLQALTANPIPYILIIVYDLVMMGALIAGCILFAVCKKRLHFAKAEQTLPRDSEASTAFVNVGVILFIAVCVLLPIVEAILMQMA